MTIVEKLLEGEDLTSLERGDNYEASLWEYQAGDLACIHLGSIRVRADAPAGTGTRFLESLFRYADRNNRWITLDLGSREAAGKTGFKRTTSTSRLQKWYARNGFRRNAAKGLFQLRGSMHRPPNGRYPW